MRRIAVLIVLATAFTATASTTPAGALACGEWAVMKSANVGTNDNELNGVAAFAVRDVWAVGVRTNDSEVDRTLIEHFDGTWTVTPSPNVGPDDNYLAAVGGTSTDDVWAVGDAFNSSDVDRTLIEHWNGNKWSVVPSPNQGSGENYLTSVVAVTDTDAWAVGQYYDTVHKGYRSLILRWNGTGWARQTHPQPGDRNILVGVSASSVTNVTAVGNTTTSGATQALIERWDGSKWSIVSHPNPGATLNTLNGIDYNPSGNQAWSVGNYGDSVGVARTLVEHLTGTGWHQVDSPGVDNQSNYLNSVASAGASDVFAGGFTLVDGVVGRTLIERWDGDEWKIMPSPNVGDGSNRLAGIAVTSRGYRFAVGTRVSSSEIERTLILAHCD
jgi:hypothetical protein